MPRATERDYRAARARPTLELELVGRTESRYARRWAALYSGALALGIVVVCRAMSRSRGAHVAVFVLLGPTVLFVILENRSRPGPVRLSIDRDEVVPESAGGGHCIARCRRDALGVMPPRRSGRDAAHRPRRYLVRHARARDRPPPRAPRLRPHWLPLARRHPARLSRRVRLGSARTGYRWRVAAQPGFRAQYDLEHADWLALLEALELTDQAEFPELEA